MSNLVARSEMDRYLAEVNRHPVLSRDAEYALAKRLHDDGDVEAAHTLVVSNLRFVVAIAHRYHGYGLRLLDLIQEGNIGLMHAVRKFDPDRGYRLISYAVWWIRAHIQAYVMRSWSLVKLGSGRVRRKLFFKLRSERADLEREAAGTGSVSRESLAERLGVELTEIDEMELRMSARDYSLDAPLTAEGGASHLEMLPGGFEDAEEAVAKREELQVLDAVLEETKDKLTDKEAYILEHRLLSDDPPTLAEIGEKFSVSRERIRQLEQRLIGKLRAGAKTLDAVPGTAS